jgi:hypothetical protein
MTVQVSQIYPPESSLLQDSYIQNSSDNSCQKYLDEEQKRLAFLLSPFTQFNFGSWFAYSDPNSNADNSAHKVNLFSDIELIPSEKYAGSAQNSQTNIPDQTSLPNQPLQQTANYYFAKPAQILLQELLAKTGWLAPNLEASPLFFQAQLAGKLLSKLDLQFLVDQILSQVKLVKEKGKVELTLGLRPENLGEILLTLTSRSGMVSIQIQAPEETKKLIEAELAELKLALKKAKVNLEEIEVLATKEVDRHA